MKSSLAVCLLWAAALPGGAQVTIEVSKPRNAPGWAALERRLLDEMSAAAFEFTRAVHAFGRDADLEKVRHGFLRRPLRELL